MVVEDDRAFREALAALLELEGFGVIAATDGADAMDVLHGGERPDVILLDLMMPHKDGRAFRAEQVADPRLADIPVVLLSADEDLRREANQLGVSDYLPKPVPLTELLTVVDRHCSA
jgi:CheY-like chemotaxis protein